MRFVELLTRNSWKNSPEQVEELRECGWSDQQLAEAVYITALFAFFNRVADGFGLADPGYLEASRAGTCDHRPADAFRPAEEHEGE